VNEAGIWFLEWSKTKDGNERNPPGLEWLNLLERRLMESRTTVIIPFDHRVIFVGLLNCADLSSWLSEVAQTLHPISGTEFLVGGRWFGKRRLLGTVCIRRRAGI
jgi:hypothetical protein